MDRRPRAVLAPTKVQLRIRKHGAGRLLNFAKALGRSIRKEESLDENDSVEKAVAERRICNADRANGRTSRAMADYFPVVGGREGLATFSVKCIVLR